MRVGERWSGGRGRGARGKEERIPCLAAHPASVAIPMQGTGSAARPERQLEQIVVVAAQVPSSPPPLAAGQLAGDCRVERSRTVGPREQVQHNKRRSVLLSGSQAGKSSATVVCTARFRPSSKGRSSAAVQVARAAELQPGGKSRTSARRVFAWVARPQWQHGPNKGILSIPIPHPHPSPHTHTHPHIYTDEDAPCRGTPSEPSKTDQRRSQRSPYCRALTRP